MATTKEIEFQRRLRADAEHALAVRRLVLEGHDIAGTVVRAASEAHLVAHAAWRDHVDKHGDIAELRGHGGNEFERGRQERRAERKAGARAARNAIRAWLKSYCAQTRPLGSQLQTALEAFMDSEDVL